MVGCHFYFHWDWASLCPSKLLQLPPRCLHVCIWPRCAGSSQGALPRQRLSLQCKALLPLQIPSWLSNSCCFPSSLLLASESVRCELKSVRLPFASFISSTWKPGCVAFPLDSSLLMPNQPIFYYKTLSSLVSCISIITVLFSRISILFALQNAFSSSFLLISSRH